MIGGSCTGKSTLAAALFAELKELGLDYDLVTEQTRALKKEFGRYQSTFERFYGWRQQEREELRSTAAHGFITDSPLFGLYVSARQHSSSPRDLLAVRELFRMCLETQDRYQLFVIAKDPEEIAYKKDGSRSGNRANRLERHRLTVTFIEHFWPEKICYVSGSIKDRMEQVKAKLPR